jgi:hypothetical protein
MDKDNVHTAIKDTFKIMLGFWVGYFGYMDVIPAYTAGIASTMALLLGNFAGSALVKNMGRLQGVVFGMVVGQIFYAAFGWCTWWGYLGVMASLFGLVSLGLFLYYHSAEHSTLGCLMAAIGAQCLLQGCKESGNHINRSAYYTNILVTVVAVLLVCAIDTITARTRASDQATDKLVVAWQTLYNCLEDLLDPSKPPTKRAKGALRGNIAAAASLNAEAGKEPRFWRTPYRGGLFDQVIESAYKIRFSLALAEYVGTNLAEHNRATATYNQIAAYPQFIKVRDIMLKKMKEMQEHLEIFGHETDHPKDLAPKDSMVEFDSALEALFQVLAKDVKVTKSTDVATVEDLPACQVSVVLNAVESIMKEICALEKGMCRSARSSY